MWLAGFNSQRFIGGRAHRQAIDLRKDEPHPMSAFAPRAELGKGVGVNTFLGAYKAFEIKFHNRTSAPSVVPFLPHCEINRARSGESSHQTDKMHTKL